MAHDGPLRAATFRPSWSDRSADEPHPRPSSPAPPGAAPGDAGRESGGGDLLQILAAASLLVAMLGFVAGGVLWRADMFVGLIVAPILVAVTLPLARAADRAFPGVDAASIVMLGLGAKLVGVQVRYYVIEGVYRGVGDSTGYDTWGRRLAPQFLDFDFTVDLGRSVLGTGFLRYLSGLVYVIVGSHQFAAFLVFGFFAFMGVYLLYRAFGLAVPGADMRRFGLLAFLWPSMLFWPSSVGKDSWVLLCIGVASYGIARILTVRPGAFLITGLGLAGVVAVRPHVAILLGAAVVPAYFLRRGGRTSPLAPAAKVIGLAVLLVGFSVVAAQAERFFGFEDLDSGSVEEVLVETQGRTSQGGSAYTPVVVRNPIQYPWAVVTVLVRPFPTEADNGQMLFTSLEGFVLLLLIGLSIPRLASIRQLATRHSYVVFVLMYVAMFCFAFAAMGNFGILARQRVQMLPFLFALLSLPYAAKAVTSRRRDEPPRFRTINDR